MAITQITYTSLVTSIESPSTNTTGLTSSATITQAGIDTTWTLTPSTVPNVSKDAYQAVTLSSGAATLDLTSLSGINGAAVTITALKGRIFKFKNPSANKITIAKGASNGYTGLGTALSIDIPAGGEWSFYDGGNGVVIDATHKTLDITGTGTDTLYVMCAAGT